MKKDIFVVRYKYHIIIITVLLIIISIPPLLNTKINSDLESYLPETEEKINNDKIEKVFGKTEPLVIVFDCKNLLQTKTLERIQNINNEFENSKDFEIVASLFNSKNIKSEYGSMIVEPAIKEIPQTENDFKTLKNELSKNELVNKLVVSQNFKYTQIILNPKTKIDDSKRMKIVNDIIKKYPGNEKVSIFGQTVLRTEAKDKIVRDLIILLPLALILMCLFLWFSFKEKRGVLLPVSAVIFSTIIAMTLIPLLDWEMSIIGILIPIMMIAIANNYGIHFIIKYQEINAVENNLTMKEIVEKSFKYLFKPVILTGLTTIAGVAGLITHIMIPAKQMGIVSAIGITFALVMSLTFVPAALLFMKKGKIQKHLLSNETSFFDKLLTKTGIYLTKKPKSVILFFVIFLITISIGFFNFKIAADFNSILPKKHSFNKALNIIDKDFGGTKYISILFESDIKDPKILKKLDFYEKELKKLPETGSVTSLATVVRIMSRAIYEPSEKEYNKIPDTRNGVAQLIELYMMSGSPEDFEKMVDFDFTKAVLNIQYKAHDLKSVNKVIKKVEELTKNDTNCKIIGGYSLVEQKLSMAVTVGQKNSLIFAFLVILFLLIWIFKNIYAGILGSLPLVFAVLSTFGIMGITGVELNIVTALLSSISIGLGVDYTIHIFWRIKAEMQERKTYAEAIQISLTTIGKGIIINAFSVILGFSVLFFSSFPLIQAFAFLIIASLFLCLICALFLVPAIIMIVKPGFLRK